MLNRSDLIRRYSVIDRSVPHLRANFISSLDGGVSVGGVSGPLNNADDKKVFHVLRMLSDVVLVGAGTVRSETYGPLVVDDESSAWRMAQGLAPQPVLAIVSARLDLDPDSEVFTHAPVRPLVITHHGGHEGPTPELTAVADVETCGAGSLDVASVQAMLLQRGLPQVLTEGGPRLFGTLVAADAVDELCLTLSPLLTGAGAGRISEGAVHGLLRMKLAGMFSAGNMLMLRYLRDR